MQKKNWFKYRGDTRLNFQDDSLGFDYVYLTPDEANNNWGHIHLTKITIPPAAWLARMLAQNRDEVIKLNEWCSFLSDELDKIKD